MLRHFAPRAALYAIACSLALPVSPLAAEEPSSTTTTTTTTTPVATDTAPTPTPTATTPAPPPPPKPAPKPTPRPTAPKPNAQRPTPKPKPKAKASEPKAIASGSTSVSIRDFAFGPTSVTVNAGDTVTWTNTGDQGHSATGSGFDTGILEKGHSGSHTFSKAGTFSYICKPHPFMKAKVVVRAASSGGGGTSSPSTSDTSSTSTSPTSSSPSSSSSSSSSSSATLPKTGSQVPGLALLGGGLFLIGLFTRRHVAAG